MASHPQHSLSARDAPVCGLWPSARCIPSDEGSGVGVVAAQGPRGFGSGGSSAEGLSPGEELVPPLRRWPPMAAGGLLAPVGLLWLCLGGWWGQGWWRAARLWSGEVSGLFGATGGAVGVTEGPGWRGQ